MSKTSKKIKTVILKARYLESELDLIEGEYFDCSQEFMSEVHSRIENRKKDPDFALKMSNIVLNGELDKIKDMDKNGISESTKKELPKDFKKIYRKIMLIVHPDRLESMRESEEKSILKDLAASANKAAREEDWYLLVSVALDLNISLEDLPETYVDKVNNSCNLMENKINNLKTCYAILWKNSSKDKKNEILDNFINMKFNI